MKTNTKVSLIVAVVVSLVAGCVFWLGALDLQEQEFRRGGLGYVSDETWYVSASRVILTRIFRYEPKQIGEYGATVVIRGSPHISYLTVLGKQFNVEVKHWYLNIVNTTQTNMTAIYIAGSRNGVQEFIKYLEKTYGVDTVIPGWRMPDRHNIHVYLNLEHPPLGKYLVALSMVVLGDQPIYWRVPIVLAGALTVFAIFLILEKLTKNTIIALVGAVLLTIDPISRAMFSISMLDGYVALFTALSTYLAIRKRYTVSLVVALVSGLFKATGLFAAIPPVVLMARSDVKRKKPGKNVIASFLSSLLFYASVTLLLYLSMLTLVSLPLINYLGVGEWYIRSIVSPVRWHLSVKCTGAGCPVSSAPWEWFLGVNSFPLYVYPGGGVLYARGVTPLWLASLLLLVISVPLVYLGLRDYGYIVLYYLCVLGGYVLVWVLGGRSQYSFYSIQLAPLIYINTVYVVGKILPCKRLVSQLIRVWVSLLEMLAERFLLLNQANPTCTR